MGAEHRDASRFTRGKDKQGEGRPKDDVHFPLFTTPAKGFAHLHTAGMNKALGFHFFFLCSHACAGQEDNNSITTSPELKHERAHIFIYMDVLLYAWV